MNKFHIKKISEVDKKKLLKFYQSSFNLKKIDLDSLNWRYRYGFKQYERIQEDQKTPIADIEGVNIKIAKILVKSGVSLVSDLLDSDMDNLLSIKNIDEEVLDSLYESVQNYVEREIEPEVEEEQVDLSLLGIDIDLDSENPVSEVKLDRSTSEEE